VKAAGLEKVMISENVRVMVPTGTDARTTAMMVQIASKYDSSIRVVSGEKSFNAKSIMGMLTLGLQQGEDLQISADGRDEKSAMDDLVSFLSNKVTA
jgi:phosphotransferase system HPr (HPr) family protein